MQQVLKKYPTILCLGKELNPSIGEKALAHRTKGEIALNEEVPSLALMRTTYGKDGTVEWLKIQFKDLFHFVEIETGNDDNQIRELSKLILAKYYYLNAAEIIYFCAECKLAMYGKFYSKAGVQQLAEMLKSYINARNREIASIEQRKNAERIEAQQNGYKAYIARLMEKAKQGDEEAKELLTKHGQIYGTEECYN